MGYMARLSRAIDWCLPLSIRCIVTFRFGKGINLLADMEQMYRKLEVGDAPNNVTRRVLVHNMHIHLSKYG